MTEVPKELQSEANSEILKYSLMAMGSSLIPGKEFDPMVDSLLQYQMIQKLQDIYEIKNKITLKKFAAVIIDNLAWKVVGSKLTGLLKYLPPPFNSAAALQIAWDFVTTFAIGHAFRKVFEVAYRKGVDPDMSNISSLVMESIIESGKYFVRNFTTILGMSKITLEKVDIDIDEMVKRGKEIFDGQDVLAAKFQKLVEETKSDVTKLSMEQADFDLVMAELANKIDTASIEMLETEINLRELNGEQVQGLRAFLKILKNL